MSEYPTPKECIKILKEHGCSDEIINHCKAVRDIAVKMAKITGADVKLVESASLLHDIGRSKTHDLSHAVEGAKIARQMGLPDKLIKIIERHIGAGLSADEAKKLGLPSKNYIPETLEEKIVCHADNLVDCCKKQPIENEVERALKNGNKNYALRLVKLHKELSELCGMDVNKI
jgi:uncharacterized protein (TIGR00295 family)